MKLDKQPEPYTRVLGGHAPSTEIEVNPPEPQAAEEARSMSLTTHSGGFGNEPIRMAWGAPTPTERGPVVATTRHESQRNAIGAHSGGYSIYKALAVVSGGLDPEYMPELSATTAVAKIGPFPAWHDPERIVTIDPYGHAISEGFAPWIRKGYDVRPTIAVTKAHIELPEFKELMRSGTLVPDGDVLTADGQSFVTKCAIEPVWFLPGIAKRFQVSEDALREALFKETNSMYPELVTRRDLKVFLPPIGGMTVYIWGDPEKIPDESVELTCRVHDECNGSDVFGSDICTCRPYLTHAIMECVQTAQRGGTGVVVYFRKEGRALGEVTKYLVYNMRKRQAGGDRASEYFNCTKTVAGVTDTRFQGLMPDVLHWLGITKIHRFISMSDMKHDAIVATGIKIEERVEIPPEMVPKDAQVEITAKVFGGYHGGKRYKVDEAQLNEVKGREYTKETEYSKSVKEGGGFAGTADGATQK
jgi:GTP cyclohydrolase II